VAALVEGRGDNFAGHRALHFRHFLGALVDEQHEQNDVGVVLLDRMRDVLKHDRLTGLRRRHEQAPLALADGGDHIDDAARDVFLAAHFALEQKRLVRVERREVLEHDLMFRGLGRLAIDLVDLDQREIAFAVLRRAHFAFDRVAGVQIEAPDLRGADVDVVRACEVGHFWRTQKAEAIGQHFERAVAEDSLAGLGALFQDGEHQFLLAQTVRAFDLEAIRHLDQLRHVQRLKLG